MHDDTLWTEAVRTVETADNGANLDLWLRQTRLLSIEGDLARVEVTNEFCREWIRDRYLDRLRTALAAQIDHDVRIELVLSDPPPEPTAPSTPRPSTEPRRSEPPSLNPRYTFDRFVAGPSNQLAVSAARAVAERLSASVNPLYVYAPSGLGKTHLLSAITHHVLRQRPGLRVVYLPTQRFVEDFVRAVYAETFDAFDRKYRDECDLLLLDDVHVLQGKDGTQERFFHIFNALYDRRVPIVMTSDQYPKEIPNLEERLRTRFLWGLIVDIQPPEFEMRVAILQRKAADEGISLPPDVAEMIARQITGSVRELEGVLGRLVAQAEVTGQPIDHQLARQVLDILAPAPVRVVTLEDLQRAVCDLFNVHLADLRGPSRRRAVSIPRHIAMYVARNDLRLPYPAIAEHFGNRDHSTIVSACRHVERLLETDAATRNIVLNLRRQFGLG